MADVITRTRVIVAEAVVVKPRLNILILTLMLKRNEGEIIVALPSLSSEDVQFLPTYLIIVIVKYLLMTTEVVRNDWMVHASVPMCEY